MSEILENRLEKAKKSKKDQEQFLIDYLPFIKKNIAKMNHSVLDYDDILTIAMLAFIQSIETYDVNKGSFLAYSSKIMYNRIIDEERKELRHSSKIVYFKKEEEDMEAEERKTAVICYRKEQERKTMAEEIAEFSNELEKFKITFIELHKVCPKQKKSRKLCMDLAKELIGQPQFYHDFLKHQRIPQAELAVKFHISSKTVEKYRKYIVTLVVLMTGDYPNIHTFIPKYREVEQ